MDHNGWGLWKPRFSLGRRGSGVQIAPPRPNLLLISKTLLDPASVINVGNNRAYRAAVEELKVEGTLRSRCRLRQCKYLKNVLEQEYRFSADDLLRPFRPIAGERAFSGFRNDTAFRDFPRS